MKKILFFLITICAMLCGGSAFLVEYAQQAFVAVEPLQIQTHIETVVPALAVPAKTVHKLPSAGTQDSLDAVVSEFMSKAGSLDKEIKIEIGQLSEKTVADALLGQGICYSLAWSSVNGISGAVFTAKPTYKLSHEVLYAHRTGDTDKISQKAGAVYDAAKKVISENINDTMSEYQKELAIHDYLVLNSEYDIEAAKLIGNATGISDSFTSYGLLYNKKGVCQAYSEAMNIFMGILDIECEEVTGESKGMPHAWNRVKIEGEYYNVDATWDDPVPNKPGEVSYAYFNISDEMIMRDHVFDAVSDKKCTSDVYNYFKFNNLIVKNQSDFERVVGDAIKKDAPAAEMRLDGFDINSASLDFAARLTEQKSFKISVADEQNVVKVYLK